MRAARSPDVAAEKAPPVSPSSGWASGALAGAGVVSGASDILLREKIGNMTLREQSPEPGPGNAGMAHRRRAETRSRRKRYFHRDLTRVPNAGQRVASVSSACGFQEASGGTTRAAPRKSRSAGSWRDAR